MSDLVGDALDGLLCDTKPYQSQWMSHWMQKGRSTGTRVHKISDTEHESSIEGSYFEDIRSPIRILDPSEAAEMDLNAVPNIPSDYNKVWGYQQRGMDTTSNILQTSKQVVTERGHTEIRSRTLHRRSLNLSSFVTRSTGFDELSSPSLGLQNLGLSPSPCIGNEGSELQHFPMFEINKKLGRILASNRRNGYSSKEPIGSNEPPLNVLASAHEVKFSSKEYHFQAERVTEHGIKFKELNTAEHTFPRRSRFSREGHFVGTSLTFREHEYSTFMISEGKLDGQSMMRNIGNSNLKELAVDECSKGDRQLSKGDHHILNLASQKGKKICHLPDIGDPSSSRFQPVLTRLEECGCEHDSPHSPNCSLDDEEQNFRMPAAMNSEKGRTAGLSKYGDKTHQLWKIKENEVDFSGDKMMREPTIFSKFIGNSPYEVLTNTPGYFCTGKDAKDIDEKADGNSFQNGIKDMQKEISVKTDTMSTDAFQFSFPQNGTTSTKTHEVGQIPPTSEATSASIIKHNRKRVADTKSLDINGELPKCHLDVELGERDLLSDDQQESLSGMEQGSAWVKRLKLSSSSALVPKRLRMVDASSNKKATLLSVIMNYRKSGTELTLAESLRRGQPEIDKAAMLRDSSLAESEKQDLAESYTWIKRWFRGRDMASQGGSGGTGHCESVPEKYQGRQLPSIAAMALMGKAAINFRPCEFRNRGSFVVWNTECF
ncbi:F-box protein [Acorus calamus]|uniref:F-box protein n=1 Tax=Acorus calamus TaxID=4465 RepID=A0AAV9FLZ0_ACOCL|nr:F-box protein [Acorus calamus]